MTYHIRHHTTEAQIKAAKCAPVFTMRNEPYPEHYEAAYAKAMKMLAEREQQGRSEGSKPSVVRDALLGLFSDRVERDVNEACEALRVTTLAKRNSVRNTLNRMVESGLLYRRAVGKTNLYKVAHVSCKDRIAAAKAEAHG